MDRRESGHLSAETAPNQLGAYRRYGSGLELRLSELAILFTAAWWRSQVEWQIHEPIARKAGVSDAVIAALRLQREPEFTHADERLIYRFGKTLYTTRRIDEVLYAEAVEAFGQPVVVELVGILDYYALVVVTLNVFAVQRNTDAPYHSLNADLFLQGRIVMSSFGLLLNLLLPPFGKRLPELLPIQEAIATHEVASSLAATILARLDKAPRWHS